MQTIMQPTYPRTLKNQLAARRLVSRPDVWPDLAGGFSPVFEWRIDQSRRFAAFTIPDAPASLLRDVFGCFFLQGKPHLSPNQPQDFTLVRLLLPFAHLFISARFHRRFNPARPGGYTQFAAAHPECARLDPAGCAPTGWRERLFCWRRDGGRQSAYLAALRAWTGGLLRSPNLPQLSFQNGPGG